ncbi:23S rRNA pseudouridine(2604) synthase RluF [Fluviicola chungangensis]|uniref:Pseudouridine synthase n=1 Tax=Fluviicola chungangensis TaxID=2597671 RepID=A0A556MMP8_9FLAO|nr:23S rRNA pseudouridine(2604) synthase RluF [Fluviicola chungangensis]TSJ41227.1 23S rRNA pseudouridine(2604) synthase RluF [Fluviicola chungangensis]
MHESIRLNKFISDSGYCSRREADKYIEQGSVFINGVRAKIGSQVFSKDIVVVNGHTVPRKIQEDDLYIALNKPRGITSTTEKGVEDNIIDYIGHPRRIFPIGRLDKDSQGLIFLTTNGDIVNKILRAGNQHQKEYIVTVDKPFTSDFVERMAAGVPILGVVTKKCIVEPISSTVFKIILVQGLNRQIRRMCEYFGYNVTKLERTRIMNIELKGLPLGEWRELTDAEMRAMNELLKDSSGEADKPANKSNPAKKKTPVQQKKNGQDKRPFGSKPGSNRNSGGKSGNFRGKKSTPRGRK